jgi:hypothetical protein
VRIYFSGSCGSTVGRRLIGEPEYVLGDSCNLMLSFQLISTCMQEQHVRWQNILRERRKRWEKSKKNHRPTGSDTTQTK